MCQRFALLASPTDLAEYFNAICDLDWTPQYDITFNQKIPTLILNKKRFFQPMTWGFIAIKTRLHKPIVPLHTIKLETLIRYSLLRSSAAYLRCVIPITGYFNKTCFITHSSEPLLCLAGIWSSTIINDQTYIGFSLITVKMDNVDTSFQSRMPLIIPHHAVDNWLNGTNTNNEDDIQNFLSQYSLAFWPMASKTM